MGSEGLHGVISPLMAGGGELGDNESRCIVDHEGCGDGLRDDASRFGLDEGLTDCELCKNGTFRMAVRLPCLPR
jgi:hypothetical protein